jgi:hypothetical protein
MQLGVSRRIGTQWIDTGQLMSVIAKGLNEKSGARDTGEECIVPYR